MVIIKNRTSTAQLIEDNIFYVDYLPHSYSKIEDIKDVFDVYSDFAGGQKLKVLIHVNEHATMDKDAREYSQNNTIPAVAEAVVLNSLPQRLLYSFYLKFRVLEHPMKLFKNKELALNWLKNL